jgi:Ca2+/H+ antiporter, TMEM165/GDT1 family
VPALTTWSDGFSLPLLLSTFGLIFVAELPDKTALAALVMAARLPPREVIVGAWLAFLIQTVVAVVAGGLLTMLPSQPVRVAAGLGFLVFAVLALRRDSSKGELAKAQAGAARHFDQRPAWLATFLVVFGAEWGDLTQLATAALVAHTGQVLPIAIGAVAALWCVTVLAALVGSQLGRLLPATVLNRASAVLLATIGVVVLVSAYTAGGA